MNNPTQNLTRQAYLDQELSVEQTIAFEQDLTATARAELEAEAAFDEELAERLREPVRCPDALWERLQRQIEAEPRPGTGWRRLLNRQTLLPLAALLALVLVALAIVAPDLGRSRPGGLAGLPASIDELSAEMEIHGDFDKISAALAGHGFFLKVNAPAADASHGIEMLGLRMLHTPEGPVAELAFACCGEPVVVFVTAREAAWSPQAVQGQLPSRWYMGGREVDAYKIMAVSPHGIREVLDLFS